MRALRWVLCAALLLGGAGVTAAAELGEGAFSVEVHGFVSQGFILTTDNNYLARSQKGSFEFAEAGLNLTKSLRDDLRVGIQLFARDLGPFGNYSAKLDWFYLDYRWADWLGVRAGRVKIPWGLYNDSIDADAAHVPVLLPQSIYPLSNRDFLLALTGVQAYGFIRLGGAGDLSYAAYGGTIYIPRENVQIAAPFVLDAVEIPYLAGGRLLWETPIEELRVAASAFAGRLDGYVHAEATGPFVTRLTVVQWVVSVEYALRDLLLTAEYARSHGEVENTIDAVPGAEVTTEAGYAMASYRVSSRLTPGVYYAVSFPNVDKREGRENYQHDVAATLRVDLFPGWLLKLEGHFMHGTAGLSSQLNDGKARAELTRDWGVFLIKTTASF